MSAFPVKLYILSTEDIDDPRNHSRWEKELPDGRWKKAVRFLSPQARINSVGAGWLLGYVFWKEGIPLLPDSILYGKHGKPMHEQLQFNLSHSGKFIICAAAPEEIGCDIQKNCSCKENIVRRYFSEKEQQYVFGNKDAAAETGKDERFLRIWTRKESCLKRTGEGLTGELCKISCLDDENFYEKKIDGYMMNICYADIGKKTQKEKKVIVEYVDWPFLGDKSDKAGKDRE